MSICKVRLKTHFHNYFHIFQGPMSWEQTDFSVRVNDAINSLSPGRWIKIFKKIKFQIIFLPVTFGVFLSCTGIDSNDIMPTLIQMMTWCCEATSHYLGPCCPKSITPYGVTRPQWVNFVKACELVVMTFNSLRPSDAYMRRWTGSSLVQIMASRLFGAKPLSEPMLEYR